MKFKICLLTVSLFFVSIFLQAQDVIGVNFYNQKFESVLDSAKAKKKLLMIQCSAEWCLPCKQMEKYTFTDGVLIAYAKKELICKKWDGASFDDIDWLSKYKVQKFPTTLFINASGKEVFRLTGFQSAKSIIDAAEKYYHPKKILLPKKIIK
jgi:thiol:disulfide interchange protein DsbD